MSYEYRRLGMSSLGLPWSLSGILTGKVQIRAGALNDVKSEKLITAVPNS